MRVKILAKKGPADVRQAFQLERFMKVGAIETSPRFKLIWSSDLDTLVHGDSKLLADSDRGFLFARAHYERIIFVLKYIRVPLGWSYKDFLEFISDVIEQVGRQGTLEMHLIFGPDNTCTYEVYEKEQPEQFLSAIMASSDSHSEIANPQVKPFQLYIDGVHTLPCPQVSMRLSDNRHGNETRSRFLEAFSTSRDEDFDETRFDVVLCNGRYSIITGCETSIAIFRPSKGYWMTPRIKDGADLDPMRQFLLKHQVIREQEIDLQRVRGNPKVIVFSASLGIHRGIIMNPVSERIRKKKKRPRNSIRARPQPRPVKRRPKLPPPIEKMTPSEKKRKLGKTSNIPGVGVFSL